MQPDFNLLLTFIILSALTNIVFGVVVLFVIREKKRSYESLHALNVTILEKNETIAAQGVKLSEFYEKLLIINQRLEGEVKLRTEKMQLQHRKLVEITNFNSHKLRGPLASILGLLTLIQKEEINSSTLHMLRMLEGAVKELDEIVREFSHRLDTDV